MKHGGLILIYLNTVYFTTDSLAELVDHEAGATQWPLLIIYAIQSLF